MFDEVKANINGVILGPLGRPVSVGMDPSHGAAQDSLEASCLPQRVPMTCHSRIGVVEFL